MTFHTFVLFSFVNFPISTILFGNVSLFNCDDTPTCVGRLYVIEEYLRNLIVWKECHFCHTDNNFASWNFPPFSSRESIMKKTDFFAFILRSLAIYVLTSCILYTSYIWIWQRNHFIPSSSWLESLAHSDNKFPYQLCMSYSSR